jgi:hypothetical protein
MTTNNVPTNEFKAAEDVNDGEEGKAEAARMMEAGVKILHAW